MTDKTHSQIIQLENKFLQAVKDTLDLQIRLGSSQHANDLSWNNFQFRIPTHFEALKDTKYYCNETKLLHFTSLEILFSIINESSIRMYNLLNCKDPSEYVLAGEIFNEIHGIEKDLQNFNSIKSMLFVTSLTDEKNKFSSYHWEHYGHNYKGVAIEFEIKPEYQLWNKFILSRTFYEKLSDFDELFNAWKEIQIKSPNCTYDIKMNWLLSLYKDKMYTDEQEIRLLVNSFHFPNAYFSKFCYSSVKSEEPELDIKYFKLPLYDEYWNLKNVINKDIEKEFLEMVPKLKISRIYIGSDLNIKNWRKFESRLRLFVYNKTGNNLGENDIQVVPKARIV
jgi:hypothetical protein